MIVSTMLKTLSLNGLKQWYIRDDNEGGHKCDAAVSVI